MEQAITRAKLAAVAAGAVMLFTSGIVAYGIVEKSIEASVGGGLAGLAAAAMLTLAKVRVWTVDTSAERRQLEEASRRAHDTQTRYLAVEAAFTEEHRRRVRDLEAERLRLQRQYEVAKRELEDRFEARREALIVESMGIGVELYLKGLLDGPEASSSEAKIMAFPVPEQQMRERATAHPADPATQEARDRGVARP
ncbi:hypothetical protein ACFWTC_02945 [Streptomyces sp. NPDC058619]|uniref:hypothetical protein n=1 Tax=unclassified Streptomyces TaxID=2593676 RepID=UPI00365E93D8